MYNRDRLGHLYRRNANRLAQVGFPKLWDTAQPTDLPIPWEFRPVLICGKRAIRSVVQVFHIWVDSDRFIEFYFHNRCPILRVKPKKVSCRHFYPCGYIIKLEKYDGKEDYKYISDLEAETIILD